MSASPPSQPDILAGLRAAQSAATDEWRRMQARTLDLFGFGVRECEYVVVATGAHWRLRRYDGHRGGVPLLLVPAPIKRPYIWDLTPSVSAIRYCLDRGFSVDHVQRGAPPKVVVWAHNSHVGDARATEMGQRGEWNIGSLVREAHGRNAMLIGFSTHDGTVRAASAWNGQGEVKSVRSALAGSYEELCHAVGMPQFLLVLRDNEVLNRHLDLSRLQRAIGVLYLPQTERNSHYFFAQLPEQFDALIHIDTTRALEPLPHAPPRAREEALETYPSGL